MFNLLLMLAFCQYFVVHCFLGRKKYFHFLFEKVCKIKIKYYLCNVNKAKKIKTKTK